MTNKTRKKDPDADYDYYVERDIIMENESASEVPDPVITRDEHGTGWQCGNRNAFWDRGYRVWILCTEENTDYCKTRRDMMRWLRTGSLSEVQ